MCLTQMQDVDYGTLPAIPAEADLLTLYIWKTGLYSFSLPLAAGAMLANAKPGVVSLLGKPDATEAEIAEFRRLIEATGVKAELARHQEDLARESARLIGALEAPRTAKEVLKALLDFVASRSAWNEGSGRKVLIAREYGYCNGIKWALSRLDRAIADNPGRPIYSIGEIIHNAQDIHAYEAKGARKVQEMVVIGGSTSSNTRRITEICAAIVPTQ